MHLCYSSLIVNYQRNITGTYGDHFESDEFI